MAKTPSWVNDSLRALGGHKALVMLGARNLGYSEKDHTVTMKLPKNASGANYLIIKLTSRDLYDLELQSIRKVKGSYKQTLKARLEGAYADMVRSWVENKTGMYLSLGTMGRNPRRRSNPSYLDRLIKMQAESYGEGETYSPSTGGFLLPNGMFLNMGMYGERGDDHRRR